MNWMVRSGTTRSTLTYPLMPHIVSDRATPFECEVFRHHDLGQFQI